MNAKCNVAMNESHDRGNQQICNPCFKLWITVYRYPANSQTPRSFEASYVLSLAFNTHSWQLSGSSSKSYVVAPHVSSTGASLHGSVTITLVWVHAYLKPELLHILLGGVGYLGSGILGGGERLWNRVLV